ncbi:MAG: response regulator, partial [Omnitrophica WOR_2 bacterium]
ILVVDDEPGIVQLCVRLLERSHFRVIATSEPLQSVPILEKEHIDLLLVDIRMPGIDGFQLIDLAHNSQPDLAVVIMTGFGTVETAIEALRRGADSLVLKPFAGNELVQSVQRALKESQRKQDVLRLQTLRPLFAISESLYSETNPERLRALVLDVLCSHLRCNDAGIYQCLTGGAGFQLIAARGNLPGFEPDSTEDSFLGYALSVGGPLQINSEGPGDPELQNRIARLGYSSVVLAPIELKEGISLVLAARGKDEAAFRSSDLETLALLSRQAAVALENARLHTELRTYIRKVEESQRALIQAEKLAIAGRLTASIAHEINNPLQSVQNCLHLAGRKELKAKVRADYLTLAQAELERLMHTVQRMLDYYRPGALDRKPENMHQLLQHVLALVKPQFDQRHIETHLRLGRNLPQVLVVSDQIQQVLLNLLLNAMEALPEGGQIYIETRKNEDTIEVMIEDSGCGISESQREHIFEPFVSTKEGGTGLGLAVSYGIIAAHGGSLELTQGRGQGACFRILLPAG